MISERLEYYQKTIADLAVSFGREPGSVKLLVATKYGLVNDVNQLLEAGCDLIGENRVQMAQRWIQHPLRRYFSLHMIGHLQTNKAEKACGIFDSIDTVDSVKLADALQKATLRKLPIMLETNISGEENKNGVPLDEFDDLCNHISINCPLLTISGIFTMTPADAVESERESIFMKADFMAKALEQRLGKRMERSYGMSDDFHVAIKCGSTQVRLGRAIFGGWHG